MMIPPNQVSEKEKTLVSLALDQAREGVASGGMPFGAVLLIGDQIVSRAHNRQIQDGDFLAHAEMVCLQNCFDAHDGQLKDATLVATEAPCPMCAGAAVVAGIRKLIIGEAYHYRGAYDWLLEQGVDVKVLDDTDCIEVVSDFRARHADRWNRFSAG